MSPDKMIRMANQIAAFFRTQPRDTAADKGAGHIRDYWDPRMRAQLRDLVAAGGDGRDPAVIDAAQRI